MLLAHLLAAGCGEVQPDQVSCTDPDACGLHGTCVEAAVSHCECQAGWVGTRCDACAPGYLPDGQGGCVLPVTCQSFCANLGRVCADATSGDPICGDCLSGYYEDGDRCVLACAGESNPGVVIPLDIYIMLDRSNSMQGASWAAVAAALNSFFTTTDASGIGVGLKLFPTLPVAPIPTTCQIDDDCGYWGPCYGNVCNWASGASYPGSCSVEDYADPDVPIATLPGAALALQDTLTSVQFIGGTPSEPAMGGAAKYAMQWATDHPDRQTYIIFATDGEASHCGGPSVSGAVAEAQKAYDHDPQVRTYVIGVGSDLVSLNAVAAAGGTGQAFLVDAGATQQLVAALTSVQSTQLCRYQIPRPPAGSVDFGKINVQVVDNADPGLKTTVPNVGVEDGCDPVEGGWYYDDPEAPERILLCPATCAEIQDLDVSVSILVGCQTLVE